MASLSPAAVLPELGVRAAVALAAAAVVLTATACSGSGGDDAQQSQDPASEATTVAGAAGPAAPGVYDQRVVFGQSAAFSGPAQELGRNMQIGIQAAFHEANQRGGVHGRLLELSSLDDAYEPEAAIANTLQLIEEDVFALIGAVGTPTSRSAVPVAESAGVPYIAPFTGAQLLRAPELDYVLNLRASYYQETEEMVERLTQDLGIDRIAVMYQDDSYGRAGLRGVELALERRGSEPVAVGVYTRNTTAVKTALLDLQAGAPQAVIIIGAYRPVAALVSWARYTGLDPVFMTVSFVGSNALADELGPSGEGVYVTQVVPFPTDDTLPVVSTYLDALAAYAPDAVPGFVSLEGYLAGRLVIAGLERCGREVDRACFLDSVLRGDAIDIDGFQLRYGAGDNQNQGSDAVFLTVIGPDGEYHPVGTMGNREP
ncbi:MAG: ABC transporter substrate-binding protein [Chloroflexi bacterium]|nr:ABC transporter substrate-binding protein [Chloroflexota bacterium]